MKLDAIIQGAESIAIAGHIHPDGDATGSCLGLYNYIKTYYPEKRTSVFLIDIPEVFYFMKRSDEIQRASEYTGEPFDLFISLDCSDIHRLDEAITLYRSAGRRLCIDHHISNDAFADENIIMPDVSSTSELVCSLLPMERMTKDIAECFYTGIVHDTGVFQYSCTTRSTMEIAGMLMECGIDYPWIVDYTYHEKTLIQNRLMAFAVTNARLYQDGKIIVSVVKKEDFAALGATKKDTEGIVNQLRVTKGVEVAVFLYQNEDRTFKVSMRCRGEYNLADIALSYGGGGHAKAAGFSVGSDLEHEINGIIEKLNAIIL